MSKELTVSKAKQESLEGMELDELAAIGHSVDKQAKLMLGMVFLEARTRFPSNNPFGAWCATNFRDVDVRMVNNFLNLAKFFKDRSMEGIGLSVGYLLSSPMNEEYAAEAYDTLVSTGEKVTILATKLALSKLGGGNTPPVPAPTPSLPDAIPDPDPKPEIETWDEREAREERERGEEEPEPTHAKAPEPREVDPNALYRDFLDAYDSLPDAMVHQAKQHIAFGESFEDDKGFHYRIENYIGLYAMLGVSSSSTFESINILYTHYSIKLRAKKDAKLAKALKDAWEEETDIPF